MIGARMKKTAFLVTTILSLNILGLRSAYAHSNGCEGLLFGVTEQQRQSVISDLRIANDTTTTPRLQEWFGNLKDAEAVLRDSLIILRSTVDREKQSALLQANWVGKTAAKRYANRLRADIEAVKPQELSEERRVLALPNWATRVQQKAIDSLFSFQISDGKEHWATEHSTERFGEALIHFNDQKRRLENEVLARFGAMSEAGEALHRERQNLENLLCQVDICLNLAPSTGMLAFDFVLESVDLFTGSGVFSILSWGAGGTERSQQARNFFGKLNSLEDAAINLGFDVRGRPPIAKLGNLAQKYRAWVTSFGPMGGVDRQGVDVALDILLTNQFGLGTLHSAHRLAKVVAQTPHLQLAKKRLEAFSRELRERDREISRQLKATVCEIVEGCDYDDEAAWNELMQAGGLAKQ